jgi:hypothetical protein
MAVSASSSAALTGGAYPQYSYSANPSGSAFIPEIWSGKLQVKFYRSTVLGEITNNDWEGEIKGAGDKVFIRTVPTITIRDYQKGQTLVNEAPTSPPIELTIDKGKYFSVVVDDVDEVQADLKLMDIFTNDAAEQMKIVIDADVLANVYDDVSDDNKGVTAGVASESLDFGEAGDARVIASNDVLDLILDMGLALDEQNVPEEGRWMVIPPWMAAMIKNSDLKQAYLTGDDQSTLRNGKIGSVDRFTIYTSNNLDKDGSGASAEYTVLAGTRDAISFASQITNVETIRSESTFGHIVRGLNVYGFRVTKPEAIVGAIVAKEAAAPGGGGGGGGE